MRIKHVPEALDLLFAASVVPYLWGEGGIGKTSVLAQYAASHEAGYFALHLSSQEQGDLIGMMTESAGMTQWSQPSWWPRTGDAPFILVLEEFNRCTDQAVAAAATQMILERRLHVHGLHPGVRLAATSNPHGGRYVVERLRDPAIVRRFCHVLVETNVDDFCAHAEQSGYHESVIEYVKERPHALLGGDSGGLPVNVEPSPRCWEAVSRLERARDVVEVQDFIYAELVAGLVGAEEARIYTGQDVSLPAEERLKQAVSEGRIPDALELAHAVLDDAIRDPTRANVARFVDACRQMPRECVAGLIRSAIREERLKRALAPYDDEILRLMS